MEARTYAPPAALADVVERYWVGRWDLRGQAPHKTELLGDPSVHFVFEGGSLNAGRRLVGVWTRLWTRTLAERGMVRGVKLRAGAVRAFLSEPAHRFTNRIVDLEAVLPGAAALERDVLGPEADEEAFLMFERWLLELRRPTDPEVALAVELVLRIVTDPEITAVAQLASTCGLGPRALQRLFRAHVGASPKWVICRNRLQEAALRIERQEGGTLAELAATLGYADQAHFAREFKAAVGKSPSAFAASVRDA